MNKKTLALLACPRCHGKLDYYPRQKIVVCSNDRLAFPIRKGIPLLLEMEARILTSDNLK